MLRVPWSKVTSIGDKLLQVLRVLGVFQGSILRDTARTRSILGFDTLKYRCTPSILGFITLNTRCTRSIWGSCTAPTLSTRSTWAFRTAKTSILGVFQGFILLGTSNTRSISSVLYSKVLRVRALLRVFYSDDEVCLGSILAILGVFRVI